MVGHKGWCTGTGTAEWAYMGWYLCSPNAPSRPDYDMASGPFCAPLAGRAERAGCTLVTAAHKHTSELVNSSISLSVCISFASIAAAHASSSHCRASVLFIAGAGEVQPLLTLGASCPRNCSTARWHPRDTTPRTAGHRVLCGSQKQRHCHGYSYGTTSGLMTLQVWQQ